MNRSMKLMGAISLSLFGLTAVGLAAEGGFGKGEGRHGRMHRRGGFGRHLEALNLTEEQKAQLKQMHEQQREALRPLMEQRRGLRQQIREALDAGADATRIGQLEIQAHKIDQQLKAEHEKRRTAFLSILTPEQKAQWEKLQQEREQRREQFRRNREQRREERQQS